MRINLSEGVSRRVAEALNADGSEYLQTSGHIFFAFRSFLSLLL
jgi:hypothetical protein